LRTQIPTGHSGIIASYVTYHSKIIVRFLLTLLIYTAKDDYFNTSCYSTVMVMHV